MACLFLICFCELDYTLSPGVSFNFRSTFLLFLALGLGPGLL